MVAGRSGTGRGLEPPPAGSGIVVEETDGGARITLPRLYSTGDIVTAVIAAAITAWLALWLDALGRPDSGAAAIGRAVMLAVAVAFGAITLSEAFSIVTRRFVEGRGDRLVVGRSLGARRLRRREIPTSTIRLVDRVRDAELEVNAGPEEVRIWTGDDEHRLGRHLDEAGVAWLEEAVRRLAGR